MHHCSVKSSDARNLEGTLNTEYGVELLLNSNTSDFFSTVVLVINVHLYISGMT